MNYSFKFFQKNALIRLMGIDKYIDIMNIIKDKNINIASKENLTSIEFRKKFNSFYRIRRNMEWQNYYYDFFQKNKNNKNITFDEILDYMYKSHTKTIEPSFCSKMLATINPNMPIWDSIVLKNLNIKIEENNNNKLENIKDTYKKLIEEINKKLEDEDIKQTIKEFKDFFPELNLTDVKILDFILWSNRN